MLLAEVLGFQSLVLAVCLAIPVIALVARRKWQLSVARNEEIKRLLILASEESARAELEAAVEYGSAVVSAPPNQCAVCYFPTTTRCKQCKAVRYCSGKCQIVHWRLGHKDECRPPLLVQDFTAIGGAIGVKVSKEKDSEVNSGHIEFAGQAKLIESKSIQGRSIEVSYEKDDFSEIESPRVEKGTPSASDSCSTSFSGFSTSTGSSDSSDDVSVSDSISSDENERSDGNLSPDRHFYEPLTTFNSKNMDRSEPLSPKFASLVDSVSCGAIDELKEFKIYDDGKKLRQETSQLLTENSSVCDGPNSKSPNSSLEFWKSALEYVEPQIESHNDGNTSDYTGPGPEKAPGGTSLSASCTLTKSSSTHLCTKVSEEKVSLYENALFEGVDNRKLLNRTFSSENIISTTQRRDFGSLNFKSQSNGDKEHTSGRHDLKTRDVKSTHVVSPNCSNLSDDISPPYSTSKTLDNGFENSKTSHLSKSQDHGGSLSSVSNVRLASSMKNLTSTRSKAGDSNASQDIATVSSQISKPQNGKNGLKTSMQKVVEQLRGPKLSKQHSSGLSSEMAGRYSDKGLFPYDSFVKLFTWNKEELRPCGLINCGNSCYANAVLQCLAFTPPLTAYFLQGHHSKDCVKKEWCFTCEFERLILKAREGKSPISPISIVSQLPNIGSQLGNGREEDAHEFLRYAIDTMQSVCLAEARIGASSSLEEETTLPGLTFGGYLRSKIKCMKCQVKSEKHERMMDVTVEIDGDIGSLEEALQKFTSTETLDGENKYQCGRCKSYERAKKKLTILEAPNVLTIALKRFQSGKFGKLNKTIKFPEILNMAPYMSGTSDKLAIYRLYGVIVHIDVMNAAFSGHYVCYVKNAHNKWFKVDDSTVMAVDLDMVLSKGVYMLLYARCSPRAPRSIRNSIVTSDSKSRSTPSWIGGKTNVTKRKSLLNPVGFNIPESSPGYDSFYSRFNRLQRILEEDSSSDNSSLISNNSDEGSCSTDSTRDSSTDDFSDYIFGDTGRPWNGPWRSSPDSDASSSASSSPLYSSRNSPLSDLDRYDSVNPETDAFLPSDSIKQFRNLTSSHSSSISYKARTDIEKLGSESLNKYEYNVLLTRRSTREK